jgi:hypothetical protein
VYILHIILMRSAQETTLKKTRTNNLKSFVGHAEQPLVIISNPRRLSQHILTHFDQRRLGLSWGAFYNFLKEINAKEQRSKLKTQATHTLVDIKLQFYHFICCLLIIYCCCYELTMYSVLSILASSNDCLDPLVYIARMT